MNPNHNPTCGTQYVTGGSDPSATECDLKAGHAGPHKGADPFGNEGSVEWRGGGSVAGDPLPARNVRWLNRWSTLGLTRPAIS